MPTRQEKSKGALDERSCVTAYLESAPGGLQAAAYLWQSTQGLPQPGCPLGLALHLQALEERHTADRVAQELGVTTGWLRQLYREGSAQTGLSDELATRLARYLRLPVLAVQVLAGRVEYPAETDLPCAQCEEVERAVAYASSDPVWSARFAALMRNRDREGLFKLVRLYEQQTSRRLVDPQLSLSGYLQALRTREQQLQTRRAAQRTAGSRHSSASFTPLSAAQIAL